MVQINEDHVKQLRLDLKAWEHTFSEQNDGRKPSRSDIKAEPSIAAKYKEYQKCCDASTNPSKSNKEINSRRTRRESLKTSTVDHEERIEKSSSVQSPAAGFEKEEIGEVNSTPKAVRTFIGATPQRNGIVMGLFEISAATPSRSRGAIMDSPGNILNTPCQDSRRNGALRERQISKFQLHREIKSPASSGKRYMLDSLVTPRKRKAEEGEEQTPTSMSKRIRTPQFLRTAVSNLETVEEDGESGKISSPKISRTWKRKGLVRSLSSMIQDMRKQTEDQLDEEFEMMADLEREESRVIKPARKSASTDSTDPVVENTEAEPELQPEEEVEELEEEEEEAQGEDEEFIGINEAEGGEVGKVVKPWKKKGQKRQTRRVILRPAIRVYDNPTKSTDGSDPSDKPICQGNQDSGTSKETGSNPVKKVTRKISATAHANFQRLKIKNQNSKAKGRGGYFRGRR